MFVNQLVLGICIALLCNTEMMYAQKSRKDLENKKKDMENEINELNKLLETTSNNKEMSLTHLMTLNKKIKLREEIVATENKEIDIIQAQVNTGNDSIERMSTHLSNLKKEYAHLIVDEYKNRNSYNKMMFIFSSNDFEQGVMRMKYLQEYEQYRHRQAILIDSAEREIDRKVKKLQKKKNEKQEMLVLLQSEMSKLAVEKVEQQNSIENLEGKEKKIKKQLAEKQKAARKLDEAIKRIIEKEIAMSRTKNSKGNELKLTPEAMALSRTFETNKGKLPWPVVEGVIYRQFGSYSPFPGITLVSNGIDIATTENAVARALFNGKVSGIADVPSLGKVVMLRHGEYLSVYANLKNVFVKTGEEVKTKQTLGTILFDNSENRADLHLEIWKGQNKLNPEDWIFEKQ